MKHAYETHVDCERTNCPICDGGLSNCTVCGGAESSLTKECPGRPMTDKEGDAVTAGELDYYGDEWHTTNRKNSRTR